jgi:hypothetical protein
VLEVVCCARHIDSEFYFRDDLTLRAGAISEILPDYDPTNTHKAAITFLYHSDDEVCTDTLWINLILHCFREWLEHCCSKYCVWVRIVTRNFGAAVAGLCRGLRARSRVLAPPARVTRLTAKSRGYGRGYGANSVASSEHTWPLLKTKTLIGQLPIAINVHRLRPAVDLHWSSFRRTSPLQFSE